MIGAIHIADGIIAEIVEGDHVPAGAADLAGDHVVPGLVELHTDNLERHLQPRPGVMLPARNAILAHDGELASVGITTVFDALRIGSIRTEDTDCGRYARTVANDILALRAMGVLRVRHFVHLRAEICSDTLIEELAEFGADDRVRLISLMDHTPGQRQFRDLAKYEEYTKGRNGLTDDQFTKHMNAQLARRERLGKAPEQAVIATARQLGTALASHDDTTREHVAQSRSLGIRLAEFPTTFEAAEACREAGIRIMVGAPNLLRGTSHSGNVSALELACHGLLDIVSSDYAPSLLIAAAFRLATLWDDLPRALATVSAVPADATGLHDRGRLKAGQLADLVRIQMADDTPVPIDSWCTANHATR